MVHIEELFTVFQNFANETQLAMKLWRQPRAQETAMNAARDKVKAFCQQHNLPVDFEEPGPVEVEDEQDTATA